LIAACTQPDLCQPHQAFQFSQGGVEVAVNQGRIELPFCGQFDARPRQPVGDGLRAVGAAAANAPLQLVEGRRLDQQLKAGREAAPHLASALELDLEQHRFAGIELVFDRLPRGSIEVAGKFGPLEKATRRDPCFKAVSVQKEVMDPLLFAAAGWACCRRYRQPDLGMALQQLAHQRAFADAAGTGDHGETPGAGAGHGGWLLWAGILPAE